MTASERIPANAMRPKIVRIIARLNTGGPALHAVFLSKGLKLRGFSSSLVTGVVSPGEGDMRPFAEMQGVQPIVIPRLQRDPKPLNDLCALIEICRILFATQPDIIHTHTTKAGALGRVAGVVYNLVARARGRPRAVLCHTFHGHLFHGYFPRWMSAFLVAGERLLACVTDRVITVSEQMKHELTRVYRVCPDEKCTVIPLGLDFSWTEDVPAYRGVFKGEASVASDCLAVGIVGRLTAIKNHEFFLRAASACRVPRMRFFIVGDGECSSALKELSELLGLNGRVVFTGWQRNLAKVYSDLDIASLTSLNEGTPVALIEAMAAGLPVVATKVGGVSDLMVGTGTHAPEGFEVFANGIVVPPGRPDVLGAAWEFLAARPEMREAMGLCGKSFVRERFSLGRLITQMEALYLDLVRPRSS